MALIGSCLDMVLHSVRAARGSQRLDFHLDLPAWQPVPRPVWEMLGFTLTFMEAFVAHVVIWRGVQEGPDSALSRGCQQQRAKELPRRNSLWSITEGSHMIACTSSVRYSQMAIP